MKLHKLYYFIIIIFILGIFFCFNILNIEVNNNIDAVYINKILKNIENNWGNLIKEEYKDSILKFTVIDTEENVIIQTSDNISKTIHECILNKDVILDVNVNNEVVGKVLFYNETYDNVINIKNKLIKFLISFISLLVILCIAYFFYLNKVIILPFNKMKDFAYNVAKGNFEENLDMDKNNLFGAFTESFDIMREELLRSKQELYKSECSKKELIASLSHDIKTPVAIIKSVSEFMLLKVREEKEMRQLKTINSKADTINLLVSDLFNSTLEELEELEVIIDELNSNIVEKIIRSNNYHNNITINNIPECIILAHKIRLEQVIDNIISNSNKYADTQIEVKANILGKYLEINFRDYGQGVDHEELPLIFNKFYRGKKSKNKNGTGLGLYIAKYFMENMYGDIKCFNVEDGFVVKILIKLA
ncbi:ATP-binding protein [Clostridium butyricum]|uniref:HAMP domain-containing sensor histidine kinase n=1 Tax=Clostridium butyricum TaxID=1492 RepID=UPI0024BAE1D5|nr:HAMP domain-containing sensor histidine kinase [Clostridium butyricum]